RVTRQFGQIDRCDQAATLTRNNAGRARPRGHPGRTSMRISLFAATAFAAIVAAGAAYAQNPVKIGVILPYSGQFADTATQIDNGIKLYMKQHGDTVAGRKIEIIRKDVGGIAPDVAKRLAQELVVRDKADILAGFVLTPNALAACDVA